MLSPLQYPFFFTDPRNHFSLRNFKSFFFILKNNVPQKYGLAWINAGQGVRHENTIPPTMPAF